MLQTRIIPPSSDWDRSFGYQQPLGCGRLIGRLVALHDPLKETHTPYRPPVIFAPEPGQFEIYNERPFQ